MAWIIGAVCMIFFGVALVAVGWSVAMLGWESWSSLVYFCWCPYGDPGETCYLSVSRPRCGVAISLEDSMAGFGGATAGDA